jgi:uncharacterized membrane protein
MCIAQAADIFGTGLVAGAFVMGAFAVHPAAASLDPAPHVLLRQELIRRLSRFLPPFMLLPVPSSLCALGLCRTSVSRPLDALGCALSLATVAITVAVNAPLNRRFATWSRGALPRDWQDYVRRWNVAHSIRMTLAVGAFACAILAGS